MFLGSLDARLINPQAGAGRRFDPVAAVFEAIDAPRLDRDAEDHAAASVANAASSVADRLLRSAAMLSGYAPILFFFGICAAFAVLAQLLNAALGPKRPSPTKDLPYESGMVPRESARRRFSVSFYVTAMLFIIFDVESIFLFPWATIVRQLKVFGIVEMGIFIATLLVGLLYVWRKGALRWD